MPDSFWHCIDVATILGSPSLVPPFARSSRLIAPLAAERGSRQRACKLEAPHAPIPMAPGHCLRRTLMRRGSQPAKGGRAMTVGRNPYLGPATPCPPVPAPARGMPPSRLPGPPTASGAALTLLTGIARPSTGAADCAPDQDTGTDNLPPPTDPAPPSAATGCAAAPAPAPPPSMPPSPPSPGRALAAAGAAPPMAPVVLAICTKLLAIPT